MERSLTEGNSLKQIIWFAFPLLLGNLFQQMYNVADSIIVGKTLGINALASVGASSSVNFLILGFCIGSCSGFAIPISQRFGAEDYSGMRKFVFNAAILAGILAAVLTLTTAFLCGQILHMIKTPENIWDAAYRYLLVIFLGIPFTILYNLAAGILRALGDSKSPFIFLVISTIINIFGDLFTIKVLGMGVEGAAIATVTAQAISGLLCIFFMYRKFTVLRLSKEERRFSGNLQKKLLFMGLPMGLQFSITAIGSVMMQTAINSLGTVYVGAFSAVVKVKQFSMAPFDALANTIATFCGQNLGAGKMERIKKGIGQTLLIAGIYAVLIGIALNLFGRQMIGIFVDSSETEVIGYACLQLRCMSYFYLFLAVLNVCRNAIQGMGHSGSAMIAGFVEMLARGIMAAFFIPAYGFIAACFTDQTAWVTAAIYVAVDLILIYRKEKVRHAIV